MNYRIGWFINFIQITFILFSSFSISAQKNLEKSPHVIYNITEEEGNYSVNYRFQDHYGNYQNYQLLLPVEYTQLAIAKFGVPLWLFDPYVDNDYNRRIREQEINNGLFKLDENLIEVDKSAVINYYAETFCKPIAQMIVESLVDYHRDTRRDRIEMAIRFVQDIPYGIPEFENDKKHFGGVLPPPRILIDGFGDCDSKVMLFVGILMYLIPGNDIIFLNQKDHVLSAIKELPEKDLTYIKYKNQKYLIAETAGPGLRLLGERGHYYQDKFLVESLQLDFPATLPYQNDYIAEKPAPKREHVDENVLVIKNTSEKLFRFQLSYDNYHWEEFHLQSHTYGNFKLEKGQTVLLRFQNARNGSNVYKVKTGLVYQFTWNIRGKKWEVVL